MRFKFSSKKLWRHFLSYIQTTSDSFFIFTLKTTWFFVFLTRIYQRNWICRTHSWEFLLWLFYFLYFHRNEWGYIGVNLSFFIYEKINSIFRWILLVPEKFSLLPKKKKGKRGKILLIIWEQKKKFQHREGFYIFYIYRRIMNRQVLQLNGINKSFILVIYIKICSQYYHSAIMLSWYDDSAQKNIFNTEKMFKRIFNNRKLIFFFLCKSELFFLRIMNLNSLNSKESTWDWVFESYNLQLTVLQKS